MPIAEGNKRVVITLPKEKVIEFKVKAAQADLTFSQFVSKAGSISLEQILTQKPKNSLVNQGHQNMQPDAQTVTPRENNAQK